MILIIIDNNINIPFLIPTTNYVSSASLDQSRNKLINFTSVFIQTTDRVTGRKAGSLQTEEMLKVLGRFSLSLKWQEETNNKSQIFFSSLKILCCHDNTWFHLNLTFLKP